MDLINAIIYGAVQGVTEFLPISSSGHLVLLHKLIPLPITNELAFDIALHLATLFAVSYVLRKEIANIIKSWLKAPKDLHDQNVKMGWFIIIATIPAGIAALIFEDAIENYLRSPLIVAFMLVLIGALFILMERVSKLSNDLDSLDWKKSLLIGVAQSLALIPGTSRSGISIIAGLGSGLKREAAVKFSFLISIPVIALAAISNLPDLFAGAISSREFAIISISFFSACFSGFLAVKYFLLFARSRRLDVFAYYRFMLAAVILIYFYF